APVVRGHAARCEYLCGTFVNVLYHGFALNVGERFDGEARRCVTRRNDGYEFHVRVRFEKTKIRSLEMICFQVPDIFVCCVPPRPAARPAENGPGRELVHGMCPRR